MSNHTVHVDFPGRILFIGFGASARACCLSSCGISHCTGAYLVVTAEDRGIEEAQKYGVKFLKERLTRENYRRVLNPLLGRGDFLVNVSVEVSASRW